MEETRSLIQDLTERDPAEVSKPCGFSRLKEAVAPEEAEAIEAALERVRLDTRVGRAKVYSYEWLATVLKDHGHTISSSTIARHALRRCCCE